MRQRLLAAHPDTGKLEDTHQLRFLDDLRGYGYIIATSGIFPQRDVPLVTSDDMQSLVLAKFVCLQVISRHADSRSQTANCFQLFKAPQRRVRRRLRTKWRVKNYCLLRFKASIAFLLVGSFVSMRRCGASHGAESGFGRPDRF